VANADKRAPTGAPTLAVIGIVATALVGIAGTAAGWATSRADRDTQRELARDARTYDHRAAAYVDALVLAERQLDDIRAVRGKKKLILLADKQIHARIRAFGSDPVVEAYEHLRLETEVYGECLINPEPTCNYEGSIRGVTEVVNEFAAVARSELRR
jgi:hypothetical protein